MAALRTATVVSALLCLAAPLAAGEPSGYDFGFDVHHRLANRQLATPQKPYVVTGLGSLNGTLPIRQEVRQLQQDADKWTLYMLGLSMMQYTAQTELLSWYQIAGTLILSCYSILALRAC